MLFVVYLLMFAVRRLLLAACVLSAIFGVLHVVRCLLFIVRHSMIGVCSLRLCDGC